MICQEDEDNDVFFDVGQADTGLFPVLKGGKAREGRGLLADAETLLYLPANAGIATSERTTRLRTAFRIDAFSC